ncbi:hypothetical protein KC19_8G097200 [Ceratodon purpureus]|uniref:Protein kinase domain-containing protein n=1 Tax=Ceratodon purpureus TaxID=3225 RepID=A0A8T0H2E3_CERPU|nr:hypothetical protein KC19_8G097200 [Ceratodon purpureus]
MFTGSLDGCGAACSRAACHPLSGGVPLLCTNVDNNQFFDICPNGACKDKILLDYGRSHVRLPSPASSNLSTEVARDICLQRNLDSAFKDLSAPSNYSMVYFGSSSGAFRAFPGREITEDQCNSFEPRMRPWYLHGISAYRKDIKIMVDIGNSMGNLVSLEYKLHPPGTTYLDVAKHLVLGLLQTLQPQDSVEVFSFNSSNVTSLGGAFTASYDVFNALLTDVNNLMAPPDADTSNSNLNEAIVQAVKSLNAANSLKVIIVLSIGCFNLMNSTTFPALDLQKKQVKLMVYKLPTNAESVDPFLLKTPSLQESICSVNGSFEILNALETANPLYALRSYITFQARVQLALMANNATWSYRYMSFSENRPTVTVTYPAFGSDNHLIGVAGIDVPLDDLNEPLKDLVYAEYMNRTSRTQYTPASIPMACNYRKTETNSFCPGSTLPDSSAICSRNDTSSTLADRVCCGICSSGEGLKITWSIVLISMAAVALLTIAAVAGIHCKFKTGKIKRFLPVKADLLNLDLCEFIVENIEGLVNSEGPSKCKSTKHLLIERECMDLSSKLSKATHNIREIVLHIRESVVLFKPALEELYRGVGRAKLYVCETIVHKLEDLVNSRGSFKRKPTQPLLNQRQCLDLFSKLSKTTQNIREILGRCEGAPPFLFNPALEKLSQDLEKAKSLVMKCGEEDWCTASVFQSRNEIAFQEILLDVGLSYNAIYEQARSISEEGSLPEDFRQSSVFTPASQEAICEDQLELRKRLDGLANRGSGDLKQCLAKYLLDMLNHTSDLSKTNTSGICSPFLWAREKEPLGTWGIHSDLLGAGSGASGVCSTKWMGIPCAKKVFHFKEFEKIFLKEASILAHLKHPCIVNFFCCSNGEKKGDRFIAMELMEKSLFELIVDQRGVYFSLPVVVDFMVQMARGMCYLHGQGIAHRDLKPQNVVVSTLTSSDLVDYFCVKLVDFGMSKTKVQVSKSNTISIPGVGTTNYRAPEVHPKAKLDGIGKVGWFKADVFSFAMTCAHVLSLEIPFKGTGKNKVYENLVSGNRPKLPRGCPKELVELLKDCWNTHPQSRPSFVEIWTRLEVFRHKILRGFPNPDPSLQQGKSEPSHVFIEVKIQEHLRTCAERPSGANSVKVKNYDQSGLPAREEMGQDKDSKFDEITVTSETSLEMMQRNTRQRSFSF